MSRDKEGKGHYLLLLIPELLQHAVQRALLHAVLSTRDSLHLAGRPTHEDFNVLARGSEVLLNELGVNVASLTLPICARGFVKGMHDLCVNSSEVRLAKHDRSKENTGKKN
jgi:hypothetical protein